MMFGELKLAPAPLPEPAGWALEVVGGQWRDDSLTPGAGGARALASAARLQGMLSLSPATRVFVALAPVDMRKSFNGLYAHVQTVFQQDPTSGHLFVFTNRLKNRLKVLYWDGSGLWVCANQLASHYTSFGSMKATRAARSTSWFQRLLCLIGRFGPGSSYR